MAKKVAIIMGSQSDSSIAEKAEEVLKGFNIPYETIVISAHRNPNKIHKFCKSAADNNFGVIIGIAGLAAHLPGVIASLTLLPVIGVPGSGGPLNGVDALHSIVQMPAGIPVACVGIGNSKNAALLAVQILATGEPSLFDALREYRKTFGDDES
ncbi:MAG TPA: 5-(carboxyamino)imidazole ribonucleotide mutase [Chitinispirillaceae bacterium]|nr:5-(carboxyamino)imidazole ribonucleotide mutase [Chitinispirillaceae bacterium]